jgi:hypothetical protein
LEYTYFPNIFLLIKFSQILRRRPRPMLGCGAKERRKKKKKNIPFDFSCLIALDVHLLQI